MEDIKVNPFSRPVVYDQKSEIEQQQYAEKQSRGVHDPMVVSSVYRDVMTTDKPIQGVSDEKTLTSVDSTAVKVPVQNEVKTPKVVTKGFVVKQGYWGTVFATAGIITVGYLLITKVLKK